MKLAPITRGEAVELFSRAFKFHACGTAVRTAAIAEHLRAAVSLRTVLSPSSSYNTVQANVVSRDVHARLKAIWNIGIGEDQESTISEEIEALKELGDFLAGDGGVYPSSFRVVDVSEDTLLLLGGIPVQALPAAMQAVTAIAGRARLLTPKSWATERDLAIPKIGLDEWLGLPFADLEQWARSRIARWNREVAFSGEIENASIYWNKKWILAEEFRENTRELLYRQEIKVYGHSKYRYAWSAFQPEKPLCYRLSRCTEINRDDARRVQTYLDLKSGGTIIKWQRKSPVISLTVPRPLPSPESRLLRLGWHDPLPVGQMPWPRIYHFGQRLLPLLTAGLTRSGYKLQQTLQG